MYLYAMYSRLRLTLIRWCVCWSDQCERFRVFLSFWCAYGFLLDLCAVVDSIIKTNCIEIVIEIGSHYHRIIDLITVG